MDFSSGTGLSSQRARGDRWALVLLIGLAAVVFGRDITVGGLRYSDACTHAMDGVLVHDYVLAGPSAWARPIAFAVRQYGHFPTLGIGRVYPPGFACVEAVFFAVFGISALSARLCTLCFGLAAVAGCYVLARRCVGPRAAAIATACLISLPGVVYWTRQTMLEMPTLAVLIWAVVACLAYFERPSWSRLVVTVVLTLAAVLFKQTAAFIVPVLGSAMLWMAFRRRVPVRQVIAAGVAVMVPLGGLFFLTLFAGGSVTHTGSMVSLGRPLSQWVTWSAKSFYAGALIEDVGPAILVPAAIGLCVALRRINLQTGIIILWFAVFAAMSTLIQHKEGRYFFFGFFPLALWAGVAIHWLIRMVPGVRRQAMVTAIVVFGLVVRGYRTTTPIEPDYSAIVSAHEADLRGRAILFEGHRDGDFVFAARRVLGPRGCVVLRASKLFYACASDPRFRFTSFTDSTRTIRETIESLGLGTIITERHNALNLIEVDLLHEELGDRTRYRLKESFSFARRSRSGVTSQKTVDVYRVNAPPPRRVRFVDLPIPIADRTVRIDLDDMVKPET